MGDEARSIELLLRDADAPSHPEALPIPPKVRLRSGRVLTLLESPDAREDTLSVTSPDGVIEMTVRFTPHGPVLSFAGARLSMSDIDELDLDCERLSLRGRQSVEVVSGGELVVCGQSDVHVDGENVLINCDDRSRYGR